MTQTATRPSTDRQRVARLEPPRPAGRPRVPELVVGVLVVAGCALLAALWWMSGRDRQPVLALASDVSRGEVLEAADLRVVYVDSDQRLATLGRADAARVVGRAAAADLEEGTVLTGSQFVSTDDVVADGDGVVGLSLEPGQVPTSRLGPGDAVNVVVVAADSAGSVSDAGDGAHVMEAEVLEVVALTTQGRQFVTLRLPEELANDLAAAIASGGQVRLVQVGG